MKKLDIRNELFEKLGTTPPNWWENIVSEKGIYIDIRKDNYIDIYYNGGSIIRELKYDNENYSGKINYKYLLSEKSQYIKYSFEKNKVRLSQNTIDLLPFCDFNTEYLKRIKANISLHYPSSSEKGIQAKFVINSGRFIDTEFAYNYNNIKLRIDLVWVDISKSKIVFVELKTMSDSRLSTNEICDQLKKYYDFANEFENDIIEYYKKIFLIKKKLNILPKGLNSLESINDFTLEKKPLLLLGDCKQKWIDDNAYKINALIKEVAIGAYYFGGTKYCCDLIARTKRNQFIF